MNILVTGAKGFIGKNLLSALECIRDEKDKTHNITALENTRDLNIYCYDINNTEDELEAYCKKADFVFNLAGINRPNDSKDFMVGNCGFVSVLLDKLKKYENYCPVLLTSSIQATLQGRYEGSEYGISKLAGEKLFLDYGLETGAKVIIYRLPNVFGKWSKPNYNSVVATFCHNIARDLPIQVSDETVELNLLYIDDLIEEFLAVLNEGASVSSSVYREPRNTHIVTLGELVKLLYGFKRMPINLQIPKVEEGSFEKKLYSTYLSFLPEEKFIYKLKMNIDERGSFTEFVRTFDRGQFSVNVSKPGITKGEHWHKTKNEKLLVVHGNGLIQLRKLGVDADGQNYPIVEFEVNGNDMTVVEMIPGYTHNIINLSNDEDLVTVIWCNEVFDINKPDTYYEKVML